MAYTGPDGIIQMEEEHEQKQEDVYTFDDLVETINSLRNEVERIHQEIKTTMHNFSKELNKLELVVRREND